MTEHDLELLVNQVKGLQSTQTEIRGDVKELQTAMVGSVDGTRKGFAQQLLTVMNAMEGFATRMGNLEAKVLKAEGAFIGSKLSLILISGLIGTLIGIAGFLIAYKHP